MHSGVLSVGYGAFYGCTGIEEIALPASVVSVEEQAFRGCASLKILRVESTAAPMCRRDIADATVYAAAKLIVPQGCVGEYGFANVWDKFENVEEF